MSSKSPWLFLAVLAGCGGGSAGGARDGARPTDLGIEALDGTAPPAPDGAAAAPASLVIRPVNLDVGAAIAGATTPVATLTVTNVGGLATGTPMMAIAGMGFQLRGHDCAGPLGPGAQCTVRVAFVAPALGSFTGTLSVSAAPGGAAQAALTGRGFSGSSPIMPGSADFGGVVVGAVSRTGIFTLSNTGGEAIPTITIDLQGEDYAFSTSSDCHAALPPGSTCLIEVRFEPHRAGVRPGLLLVAAGRETTAVPLTGTGLSPAALVVSPMAQTFAAAVGGTGAPVTFTFGNVGDVVSGALTLTIQGPDAADFELSGSDCTHPIASFGTCQARVAFRPRAAGTRSATLVLDGASGRPGSATLVGTATP